MYGKKFFQKQTEATRIKTLIYEEYISAYLIQNIAKYKKCYIADLFCGPGKNGRHNGSPLILIDILRNLFKLKYLQNISEVEVIFNDLDKEIIRKLQKNISKTDIPPNIKINLYNEPFEDILPKLIESLDQENYKFFFLDPFNYSSISMENIKNIFNISNAEILFFSPVFHSYRFAYSSVAKGKVKAFLNSFTTKGIHNYRDIYDFVSSIQQKLVKELKTPWVREFIIRDSSRVNGLFLISRNIESMIAANEIFWNHTHNGKNISFSCNKKDKCSISEILKLFFISLKRKLKREKNISNLELIKFAAIKRVCAKHMLVFLEQLKLKGKIKIKQLLGSINSQTYNLGMEYCKGPAQSMFKLIK